MIQLCDISRYGYGSNRYWRLDSGKTLSARGLRSQLAHRNFTTFKKSTKPRLRELYVRCQRESLSYEGMPLRELKLYAAQRGVTIPTKATANVLKMLLGTADDDATFDRFSELPPEIRQIIFQHYYDSISVSSWYTNCKHQPPITLASRTTRQESLPLFYEQTPCVINPGRVQLSRHLPQDIPYKLRPCQQTKLFTEATSVHNFARIKTLQLNFTDLQARMILDLRNKNNHVANFWIHREGFHRYSDDMQCKRVEGLESELHEVVKGIVSREGPLKLRASDIEEVGGILRSAICATSSSSQS
jgi:hypothetical protein